MSAKDRPVSKPATDAFRENFDKIFGKKEDLNILTTDEGKYTIEVNQVTLRGWFEHNELGEDRAGGLWFARESDGTLTLVDADGVAVLPKRVVAALRAWGINVPSED